MPPCSRGVLRRCDDHSTRRCLIARCAAAAPPCVLTNAITSFPIVCSSDRLYALRSATSCSSPESTSCSAVRTTPGRPQIRATSSVRATPNAPSRSVSASPRPAVASATSPPTSSAAPASDSSTKRRLSHSTSDSTPEASRRPCNCAETKSVCSSREDDAVCASSSSDTRALASSLMRRWNSAAPSRSACASSSPIVSAHSS
mmetsp:Transcript_38033/g.104974  ORF Transcript_38033/g.104974 Transcript_38033/m.104974 type:complete len:202 (+) Transcript_38033:685-1290(+)